MILTLSLKLLLAHLLGDFVLQPSSWVKNKLSHGIRSPYLYWHGLIHAMLLLVVLEFHWSNYGSAILVIAFSHLVIDGIKISLERRQSRPWLFWVDQLAHLIVLALVVKHYTSYFIKLDFLNNPNMLLLIVCLVLVTGVSSVILKIIMNQWDLQRFSIGSLENAGLYIGILERLFVFTFVITDHWQAIGFLIAAKSAFRFGDLSKAKNKKMTEYVLIGTLISFGLAIVIGILFLRFATFL